MRGKVQYQTLSPPDQTKTMQIEKLPIDEQMAICRIMIIRFENAKTKKNGIPHLV